MRPTAILETIIYAEDLDAAETFYADILGLEKISRERNRHVFFRCGEQVLLIFNPNETQKPSNGKLPVPPHGAFGSGHVCFKASAAELDSWRDHLENAGIEIEAAFEWPQGGRSIYFRDPSGNCLEFAESRIWGLADDDR